MYYDWTIRYVVPELFYVNRVVFIISACFGPSLAIVVSYISPKKRLPDAQCPRKQDCVTAKA